jgi:RNA polymerase sigma factor (sigma-70 family)
VFLEEQRRLVYRFLLAAAGPGEADDCFQETFLSALRAYPKLRDGENLRGWALAIATRKVIDAARARRRRPVPADVATVADPPAPADPDPLSADDPLWRAVRGLPARQRAALVHRFVLDRSYTDVAEAMDSSEEAARANVYQGLKRLRTMHEEVLGDANE